MFPYLLIGYFTDTDYRNQISIFEPLITAQSLLSTVNQSVKQPKRNIK